MKRAFLLGMVLTLTGFAAGFSYAATAADDYQAGLADYKAGNWQQSAVELGQAVQLDPTLWQAYQLLGYAYCQEGHLAAALDACEQSLTLHPDNPILKAFADNTLRPKVISAQVENMPPAPSALNVAEPLHNSFYVNLGGNFQYDGTGNNLGLGYGWAISNNFSIVADLRLFDFFLDYTDTLLNVSALVNAKLDFMDCHNPEVIYVIGGLGFEEWFDTDYSYNQTNLAYRLGLGLDIHLNPGFCLFFEGDTEDGVGTSSGGSFGFFNIGLKMD